MAGSIITCRICGLTQRLDAVPHGMVAQCARCGTVLVKDKPDSLERTAALSLAALVFYVPANIFPVLRMNLYGIYTQNTVWDGVVRLFQAGQWFVAAIVFAASLVIPLLKLLGLFLLVITTKMGSRRARRVRGVVLRVIVAVGPWAMLDVFLLAILVALVRLGQIATVTPGPGIIAFAAVVVLTIFAAASFDPKMIWQEEQTQR